MSYIIEAVQADGYSGGFIGNVDGEVRFVHSMGTAFKFSETANIENIVSSLKKLKELFPHNRVYKYEIRTYVPGYVGDLVRAVLVN